MKLSKLISFFILFNIITFVSQGQLNDMHWYTDYSQLNNKYEVGDIYLSISGLGYIINKEYDNPIVGGETLTGFQQIIRGSLKIDDALTTSIGIIFQPYFGIDDENIHYLLNLNYTFNKGYFRLGDFGRFNYRKNPYFIEAFDYRIKNLILYGFEGKYNFGKSHIYYHFAVPQGLIVDRNQQEELFGGLKYNIPLFTNLSAEFQFNAHHFGGENLQNKNVSSFFYLILSLTHDIEIVNSQRLNRLKSKFYIMTNLNQKEHLNHENNGWGMWISTEFYCSRSQHAVGGYYTNKMYIQNGDPLMGYETRKNNGRNQLNRSILFYRFTHPIVDKKKWTTGIQTLIEFELNNNFSNNFTLRFWLKYNLQTSKLVSIKR